MSPGRVLVTGASGFLGRHLLQALAARESVTVALCRRPADLADLSLPALTVVGGDVGDAPTCARALAGIDTVFHLAAVRSRPGRPTAEMKAINEVATVRLARQSVDAGVRRFVHVSTALVFGPSAVPLDETARLGGTGGASAYLLSKAHAIPPLRQLASEGASITTLYPTIVYGPDHPSRPNRVTSHIRRLLRRPVDVAVAGGQATRDLVHVDDVVTTMVAAAAKPEAAGDEFLVSGEAVSQRGLGELVARCAGRRPPLLVSAPMFLARPVARCLDRALGYDSGAGWAAAVDTLGRDWCFDGSKARTLLDHRPRALARGVEQTVEWIRRGVR
jgi:nucleoside-diphosphate-sugar epimerase